MKVSVDVTNTGEVSGKEIVEIYAGKSVEDICCECEIEIECADCGNDFSNTL